MTSKSFRYVVADVFTDVPLAGNQLAVFTDARDIPESRLLPLTREMAFSETVFVYLPEQGGHVRIRIFTPAAEVPFAGHPVLGTAFVLAGPMQLVEIRIETGAGIVPVVLEREENRLVFGRMSQPVPTVEPFRPAERLLSVLGVEHSQLPVEIYDNGMPHVYVVLEDEEAVARLEPDMAALARFQNEEMTGIGGINCLAGDRWPLEDPDVLPGGRRSGGSCHRLGRRPARVPPRAPRPDCLRRGDRDLAGCRAEPAEHALRACRGHARPPRASGGGRLGRRRRAWRVPHLGVSLFCGPRECGGLCPFREGLGQAPT